jgi:hypothetical protein
VVDAPLGVVVPSLPPATARIEVDGVFYYVADSNYFRRTINGFIVVDPFHH